MMKFSITTGILALALGLPCIAAEAGVQQTSRVSPPVLGFVFDFAAGALRPITGIPGASVLGGPLDAGLTISQAAFSPRHDYALVLGPDRAGAWLVRLAGSVSLQKLSDAPEQVDALAVSPSGTAAALYSASEQVIQIVTGLPDSPAVRGVVACPRVEGTVGPMAVSDDGELVAVSAAGLNVVGPGTGPRQLPVPGQAFVMAFLPASHDFAVASREAGILIIRSNAEYENIGDYPDIGAPSGMSFPSSGRLLLSGSSAVAVIGLEARRIDLLPCNCAVGGLSPLSGSVFALNQASGESLKILDAGGGGARILFVPPDTTADAGGSL
jgi:hypothetical protein